MADDAELVIAGAGLTGMLLGLPAPAPGSKSRWSIRKTQRRC